MSPIPGHHFSETTWRRSALGAFVILTAVFAILLYRAEHHTDRVEGRVDRVESPCLRYGRDSKICQQSFEEAVATINHRIACFIEHKAGPPPKRACIGVRLRIEEHARADLEGGGASQTPTHSAHQQPGPQSGGVGSNGHSGDGQSGSHPHPSHGGGNPQPAPSPPSAPATPSRSEPGGSAEASSPKRPPVSSPPGLAVEHPTLEGVGHVVEDTPAAVEGAAGKAVEGVHGTAACTLSKAC